MAAFNFAFLVQQLSQPVSAAFDSQKFNFVPTPCAIAVVDNISSANAGISKKNYVAAILS